MRRLNRPVPLVRGMRPNVDHVVAVVVDGTFGLVEPDELELEVIRLYRNYVLAHEYRDGFVASLTDPNVVVGHDTVLIGKRPDGTWSFRRSSWDHGPLMVPSPGAPLQFRSPGALLDWVEEGNAEWGSYLADQQAV